MKSKKLIEEIEKYGAHNYLPLPVVLSEGNGAWVKDVEGKRYLDFLSCYSALNFGHNHPSLVARMTEQMKKLSVCSRAFLSEELCEFSKEICEFAGFESVLPMNSGSEAVETALKIARKWGYKRKGVSNSKAKILAFNNNFHGRTISIISFSTESLYRDGFGPFTPGFVQVPYGDLAAVEAAIDSEVVAVIGEPIQAEAGILIPPKGFLASLRKICDEKRVLLIWDEIQTGLGRTGKNFCYEYEAAKPDMLVLGKSLGGGMLPVSAVLASRDIMDVISPGEHGSTFGGNPLACAIAREAIRMLDQDKLAERSSRLGKIAMEQLQSRSFSCVKSLRGRGLLIGIELNQTARPYCETLAEKGVLCKETHDTVIRIAPPLTIEEADLQKGIKTVMDVLAN